MRLLPLSAIACALVLASCSGGGTKPTATPTPTESGTPEATSLVRPTPSAEATPSTAPDIEAIALLPGPPVTLPAGVALYAFDGVWEGPSNAFRRYYNDAAGNLQTDTLIQTVYGQGRPNDRAFVGAIQGPANQFAAALCHGTCYGELEPTTIVRSSDGGVTWRDVTTIDRGGWGLVVAIDGERILLREVDDSNQWKFVWYNPEGTSEVVPLPHGVSANTTVRSAYTPDGLVVAVVAEDKHTVWNLMTGERLVVLPQPANGDESSLVALFERSGRLEMQVAMPGFFGFLDVATGMFRAEYQTRRDDGINGFRVTGWLSDSVALGWANFESARYLDVDTPLGEFFRGVPSIIDFGNETISPIVNFVDLLGAKAGGPNPVAIMVGPFARVVTPGDCLNVRTAPQTNAEVLGCYADGVLLAVRGEPDDSDWLAVETPDGRAGWAAKTYLEVVPR